MLFVMVITPDLVHEGGTITTITSDHYPRLCGVKAEASQTSTLSITVRSCKNYNSEIFAADLATRSDQSILILTDNDASKMSAFS